MIHDLLLQASQDVGGDLLILGIPVAVVISILVQFCKMLHMPSEWSPWASVAIGLAVASGVQATKESGVTVSVIIYTVLLAVSYALMANGIFAMVVGTQDRVRARDSQSLTATVSMAPQPVSVSVPGDLGADSALPAKPLEDSAQPAAPLPAPAPPPAASPPDVHVIGGGGI